MKRMLLILLLAVFVIGHAGDAKMSSLLLPYWAMDDEQGIMYFPTWLAAFPDMARVEASPFGIYDPYGGFHLRYGDSMYFALYVNRPYANDIGEMWSEPGADTLGIYAPYITPNNYLDLILCMNMGDAMKLGFKFNYANNSWDDNYVYTTQPNPAVGDDDWTERQYARELNFTVDLMMLDFAFLKSFNIGVDFGLPSMLYEEDYLSITGVAPIVWSRVYNTSETDGASYIAVRLFGNTKGTRLFASADFNNISHLETWSDDAGNDGVFEAIYNTSTAQHITRIKAGLSRSFTNKAITFVYGGYLHYDHMSWEQQDYDGLATPTVIDEMYNYSESDFSIPIFMSAILRVKNWFEGYAGFYAPMFYSWSSKDEDPDLAGGVYTDTTTDDYKEGYFPYVYTMLGVGFKFPNWRADLTLYPTSIFNPYLLTGNVGTSMVMYLTLTYYWNK